MLRYAFVIGIAVTASANAADSNSEGDKNGPELFALPSAIRQSNNQVSVFNVTTNFNYKETVNGAPFDTEKNWVPGIGASLSLMRSWFIDDLYVNTRFTWGSGKTDYVGAYFGQPFGSLVSTSGATVYDYDFRLGKALEFDLNLMMTPFFGMGYHVWDRLVNAGEDYSHAYAGGGLLIQWSFMSGFVLSVDGFVGGTCDSQIKVATFGHIQGSTLALGNSTLYKAGVAGDYAITQSLHVHTSVEWLDFKYGKCALDPTRTFIEPRSETSNVTVEFGLGYAF